MRWAARSERKGRDFLHGPVVNTSPSDAEGAGSIPGCGAKITHDKNKTKQRQCCSKFNKHLKIICIKRERVDWGGQDKLWSTKEALDEELSLSFLSGLALL